MNVLPPLRWLLSAVAPLVTACLLLVPQGGEAASDGERDERAWAVLERVAQHQRGEEPRTRAHSLHGQFFATIHREQGTLQLEDERWYTRDPERMLWRKREQMTGAESTVGWDGQVVWQQAAGDEVQLYEGELFDVDRELMEDQRRLTGLLLDALLMDAMLPRLTEVSYVGTGIVLDIDETEHAVEHIMASIEDDIFGPPAGAPPPAPDAPPPQLRLGFAVDADGALRRLEVMPQQPGLAGLELRFLAHAPSVDSLMVPVSVEIHEHRADRPPRKWVEFGVVIDEQGRAVLELDAELDEAMFEVPDEG